MVVICIESDRGSVRRPANRLGGELSRELLTGVLYSQPITVNEVGHLARWLDCAHKYTSFTMKQKQGIEGGEITSEFEYCRPPLIPALAYTRVKRTLRIKRFQI